MWRYTGHWQGFKDKLDQIIMLYTLNAYTVLSTVAQ